MSDMIKAVKIKDKYVPINYMGVYWTGKKYKEPTSKQKIYELPLLKYEYGMKMKDIVNYCDEYNTEMFLVGNRLDYSNCSDKWIVGWVNACYQYNQFVDYFDSCIELIKTIQKGIQDKLKSIDATYRENDMMLKVLNRSLSYMMDIMGYLSPNIDVVEFEKIISSYYLTYLRKKEGVDCIKYGYTNEEKDNYRNKNIELINTVDNISLRDKIVFFTDENIADLIKTNLSYNKD